MRHKVDRLYFGVWDPNGQHGPQGHGVEITFPPGNSRWSRHNLTLVFSAGFSVGHVARTVGMFYGMQHGVFSLINAQAFFVTLILL